MGGRTFATSETTTGNLLESRASCRALRKKRRKGTAMPEQPCREVSPSAAGRRRRKTLLPNICLLFIITVPFLNRLVVGEDCQGVLTLISRLRCCDNAMDARRGARRMVVPFASFATPQTRVIAATLRDGGDLGALLCRKPLVVSDTTACLASRMASQIVPVADAKLV
jgi:hypothetical protein